MNKNAFTLVELLAVLVILGTILLIIIPNVFGVLEDSKKNAYDTQIDLLKTNAKEYVADKKRELFSDTNTVCISVKTLYDAKYITKIPSDPRTSDGNISENLGFVVEKQDELITYTLVDDVTSNESCNVD